ncbi:MAG: UDP-N-acetylenolpyruvoylglucosamine reductase [Gammaproteobacteria bacterium]|nr:MAG: UDP-N-acetylenolpyruvoylglucosamine reductase [Gammaproteobacteria bacterium]
MMAMLDHIPLRGQLKFNEPMQRHTSWRVGGNVDRFYQPADIDDLVNFLRQVEPNEPLHWLGLGSNILVRDGGLRGTAIALFGVMDEMHLLSNGVVEVEAGVSCARLARYCAKHGLVGAEFFAGIPGTVGGALAMNAGAYGGETWPKVLSVETIDRYGQRHRRTPADFEISYRSVVNDREEWFVSSQFELAAGDSEASSQKIKQLLRQRAETQPLSLPSCGSVFRNPVNDHAARLIEASGLKGYRVGGASVSEQHANFIVNDSNAMASDIEQLIADVSDTVFVDHGVRLQPEVRVVGEVIEGPAHD